MLSNNLVKSLLFASLLTPTLYGCGGGESGGDDSGQNSGEPLVEQRATLSAIASTGGAISPEQVTVEKGESVTFTVTADEGFELSRIAGCDGQLTGNLYHVTAAKESCRVEAQFNLKRYTVSSTVTGNGEVMPPELNLAHGEQSTVSLNPHEGFSLHSATGCGGTLAGNSYTIAAMSENCVINAVFTPTVYTVTASASNGGAISPSTQTANYAGSATFTLTPEAGYQIDAVTGCNGSLNGNTYTTGVITAACSVNASFKPLTFAVTASSNAGGAISPSTQTVNYAGSATFTLTPETGYQIDAVTGCNGSLNGNTYTTGVITAACSVNASFKQITYTVTANASVGGAITPASLTVAPGASATFNLAAQEGYTLAQVSGCGGTLNNNQFTVAAVTENCSVQADFSPNSYVITATASDGGTISPASLNVTHGSQAAFTVTANTGYVLDAVTGCEGQQQGDQYLIQATRACQLTARFTATENVAKVQVETQALSAELQAQPLFLVNSEYAKPLDEQTNNSMAVEATENQLLSLTDETGEPLLMGLKLANQSNAEVTLESSAVVFVLRSNQFYGANFSDRAELNRRIEAHDKFPLLVSELGEQLKNGNPCPMDRSCSAVAAIIAERIASSLSVDDLLVAGE
ncbi:TPA: hypothetical protein RQK25_003304 [Vibrio vulnificus]|nr:hypothetical protein [Vibrio vulnificus]